MREACTVEVLMWPVTLESGVSRGDAKGFIFTLFFNSEYCFVCFSALGNMPGCTGDNFINLGHMSACEMYREHVSGYHW